MELSKEELLEEIEHQKAMVRVLRQRRHALEIQAAHHGIHAPPEILIEIVRLSNQIHQHGKEISDLQTQFAEDEFPVNEAEYRSLLAYELDKSKGYISFTVAAHIELSRLKLGIVPELALHIDKEVRSALVREKMFYISSSFSHRFDQVTQLIKRGFVTEQREIFERLRMQLKLIDFGERGVGAKEVYFQSEYKERIRKAEDTITTINENRRLFHGLDVIDDIENAKDFIENKADSFILLKGNLVDESLFIERLTHKMIDDMIRILRAIRLQSQIASDIFVEKIGSGDFDLETFSKIFLQGMKLRPGDRELIEQFLAEVRTKLAASQEG